MSEREPTTVGPERPRASDGRVPGRRGMATRQRLLEATEELLATTSYRELKVVDIARDAECSPATFYQYFPDVEAAVLVLAEPIVADAEALAERFGAELTADPDGDGARTVVDGFLDFWEGHRRIWRVVDLATEEGDLRFQSLRVRALHAITESIRGAVHDAQRRGRVDVDVDPMATAGVLVAMLAHVSSHRYGFEFWGIRTAELADALTRIVAGAVGDR